MPEKARKVWYQKGLVQAAFVSGAFGLAVILLRPPPIPVVVRIQAQPQSVATPVLNTPEPPLPQSGPVRGSRPAEDSRAVKRPKRTRSAEPPHIMQATPEVGQPKALANGKPWFLSSIATSIT